MKWKNKWLLTPLITGTIKREQMRTNSLLLFFAACLTIFSACKNKPAENAEEEVISKAAVSVTHARMGTIEDQITLNGRTVILKKNQVVAPISGYLTAINIKYGDIVEAGQDLFEIQTREDRALEQSGSGNADLKNFGKIKVTATTSGIVNEPLLLGIGAFVSEGTEFCNIADFKDLQVLVNVPFEYHNLIETGGKCTLLLPHKTQTTGTVLSIHPYVEENSQTQEVLVKPSGNNIWPENMNLTVSIRNEKSEEALLLPKKALLTNETQDDFWVMKVVDNDIAVKVPIETGIKNDSLVEINAGAITVNDLIILEGGYGLEDSSLVNILN